MDRRITIGFDLDNTLIEYDEHFYNLAREKGLINEVVDKTKLAVRENLRNRGLDEEFTKLQAEVYGKRIKEVAPKSELLETMRILKDKYYKLIIVSHKTRYPYKGPKYDLHQAAKEWLKLNELYISGENSNLISSVYFEDNKESKIERIKEQRCNIFVDDLIEILDMLPEEITRVHYSVNDYSKWEKGPFIRSWEGFIKLIDDYQ